MQTKLEARASSSEPSVQNQDGVEHNRPENNVKMMLPDLNVVVVSPTDEEVIKIEK
jgi:hypothetical protein